MIFEGDLRRPPSTPQNGDWLIDRVNYKVYIYENEKWNTHDVVSSNTTKGKENVRRERISIQNTYAISFRYA